MTTVVYEYTERDIERGYAITKKHVYTSATVCKAFLTTAFEALKKKERKAAEQDFKLVLDMIDCDYDDEYGYLVMPFAFEGEKVCHWIDIIIQPDNKAVS